MLDSSNTLKIFKIKSVKPLIGNHNNAAIPVISVVVCFTGGLIPNNCNQKYAIIPGTIITKVLIKLSMFSPLF
ncbi:hypothetical protein YSY22_10260 [Brevibacillus formosus]